MTATGRLLPYLRQQPDDFCSHFVVGPDGPVDPDELGTESRRAREVVQCPLTIISKHLCASDAG
jgi:hypothetical protein